MKANAPCLIRSSLCMFDLSLSSDYGLLALRIALAAIFIYHALPKLKNPKGMALGMTGNAHMAWFPAILGLFELLSGFGVLLGIYLQLSALVMAAIMVGAIAMKIGKWKMPFSAMDKTGWEFDFILLAAALTILTTGGGYYWQYWL